MDIVTSSMDKEERKEEADISQTIAYFKDVVCFTSQRHI